MNKLDRIPSLNKALDYKSFHNSITKNYSEFSKVYVTFLSDWLISTVKAFKDSDKFHVMLCIFKRNLNFYNDNLIKFNYDTFSKTNQFDIQKINIVEIAKTLNLPKETTRRKLLELQKIGVIKRYKKNILIDKNSIKLFNIDIILERLGDVLFKIYNVCLKESFSNTKIESKKEIVLVLKDNFSFLLLHYFEFIIPWLVRWRRFFNNDTELFIVWAIIFLNKTVKLKKAKGVSTDIVKWRTEIDSTNTTGINTMSLSDISGIPRPTVSRKVKKLLEKKLITVDEYKLLHPINIYYKKELENLNSISLDSFSKFSVMVFNRIFLN
tara:strand:+ start:4259 stop:5230 length:972 start_codon:yes stop_codon:yes gene_type:complete